MTLEEVSALVAEGVRQLKALEEDIFGQPIDGDVLAACFRPLVAAFSAQAQALTALREERDIAVRQRDTAQRQLDVVDGIIGFPDGHGHGRVELLTAKDAEIKALAELLGCQDGWTIPDLFAAAKLAGKALAEIEDRAVRAALTSQREAR